MDHNFLALIVQEGGRLITDLVKTRRREVKVEPRNVTIIEETEEEVSSVAQSESKATAIATGCVPCAIGHFGTCSGLLAESLRFGKKDGIESEEVADRVNLCLDELNTMERVDLRPEKIAELASWEKELANKTLNASRDTRHQLEGLTDLESLEEIAASTQRVRGEIGRRRVKGKVRRRSPDAKEQLNERISEKLREMKPDDE